jgi:hypothetical protein
MLRVVRVAEEVTERTNDGEGGSKFRSTGSEI